jgi:outer membrane protein TolC
MDVDARTPRLHVGLGMRTSIITFLVLLALAPEASAQTAAPAVGGAARPISLREAVTTAVQKNRVLAASGADIEVAEATELSAEAPLDAEIDANANWQRRRSDPIAGSPFQQTELDVLHLDATASQPFSFGGRVGLKLSHDYTRTTSVVEISGMSFDSTTESYSPSVQVTYFQPLLKNFGEKRYLGQKKVAEAGIDAATADLMNIAAGVVRDTIQAYWELAYAEKEVDIRRSALNLAREQLRVTQARLDVGVGAPTDLAEVRQTIATREEDLLLSELTLSERALDVRALAALDISPTEINLTPTDQVAPQVLDVSIDQALGAAYEKNLQLQALRAHGKQAELNVEVNENGLLPELDFTAAIGPLGNSNTFSDAMDRMVNFKDYQLNFGLALIAPIQRRAAKGVIEQARGALHKVRINEADLRAQIGVSVARAVDLVKQTQKRLDVDAEAIQLAQVNLDAERARFDVGRSTNFDVLRRQDELSQAQLRRIRAAADYMKAVAVLQTLTGDLLPTYGVNIKPRRS